MMSELATYARPYAVAAFKRAAEMGSIQKWSEDLVFLTAIVKDPGLDSIVNNPKLGKSQIEDLFAEICQGQTSSEAINFVKLLVRNGRLSLLPTVAKMYETYRSDHEGYVEVKVVSAYELDEVAYSSLATKLQDALGKKINMDVSVDESLLGGVLVRAGDFVVDGSIKGRLLQMQKTLQ